MVAQEDYDELAAKAEHVRMATIELSDAADRLHVPIPQALARAWADLLTWPDQIEGAGMNGAGQNAVVEGSRPMGDPQEPPLSPKFRATARMVAIHDCTWDEATDLIEHTFYGWQAWYSEALLDLGRAIAKETPFRQILKLARGGS